MGEGIEMQLGFVSAILPDGLKESAEPIVLETLRGIARIEAKRERR